jgi:hypothetical protein
LEAINTRSVMGFIEQEIDAQIEFLQRPTTKWVTRQPRYINEACGVIRRDGSSISTWLSADAVHLLAEVATEITGVATDADPDALLGTFNSFIVWNDLVATSVDEVVGMLEKGRARAAEQGI